MNSLRIPAPLLQQITSHLSICLPEEGCGLLTGSADGLVQSVIPIQNKLHSPTRFQMDERELIRAFDYLDTRDSTLLGIFHSHPWGPAHPSPTDLQEYEYPDSFMVIFTRSKTGWQGRAFQINAQDRTFQEREISVSNGGY